MEIKKQYKKIIKSKIEFYKEVAISTLQLYSITLIIPLTMTLLIIIYAFLGSLLIPLPESLLKLWMAFYGNIFAQKIHVLLLTASAIFNLITTKREIIIPL